MQTIILVVDDDDARAIHEAISRFQQTSGGTIADGDGDLRGRVIGEICRAFVDYRDAAGVP